MPSGNNTFAKLCTHSSGSVIDSHTFGTIQAQITHTRSNTAPFTDLSIFLESFIYTEYERFLTFAYTEVKPYIGEFFELPSVTNTGIGKYLTKLNIGNLWKYCSGTHPQHKPIAMPHMLAQLKR